MVLQHALALGEPGSFYARDREGEKEFLCSRKRPACGRRRDRGPKRGRLGPPRGDAGEVSLRNAESNAVGTLGPGNQLGHEEIDLRVGGCRIIINWPLFRESKTSGYPSLSLPVSPLCRALLTE